MKMKGHGAPGSRRSRFMPGLVGLLTVLVFGWLGASPALAQQCTTDAECDNHLFCDGVEHCDTMIVPNQCRPGPSPVCNDGDQCTIDYCDFGLDACASVLTSDDDRAAGPDFLCNTTDDNLDLFGTDRLCGTTDDLQGDGLCSAIDNCPGAYNPGRRHRRRLRDLSPDGTRAFVAEFTSGELSRVSLPGGGAPVTVASGLSGPTGVAVNAAGTFAFVTERGSGELSAVSLSSGAIVLVASGLSSPSDVSLNPTGSIAYVAEEAGGLKAVDLATGSVTPVPMSFPLPLRGVAAAPRPPVVMSISDTTTGLPGANVTVPVSLDDVTSLGVLSADLTVEFNPAVIGATGVSPGSLASGCTLTSNLTNPGRAVISVFCSTARTGSGSLADITFNVAGARGRGSPLHFASALLNEGSPQVCADDGRFHVPVDISGRIRYYRDHSATTPEPSAKNVGGAIVDLSDPNVFPPGPPIGGTTTACDGTYSLTDLIPVRTYQVTPRKTNDFDGGVDPFDAALNAQHVVGLISLTPNQRLAADVTGNGTLTSFDSARIAQFTVGLITQFPVASFNGGDWTFVPTPTSEPNQGVNPPFPPGAQQGSIAFFPIIESAENQDFLAVLYGDVSGNWQPPICGPSSPGPAAPVGVEVARLPGAPGGSAGSSGGNLELPKLLVRTGDVIRVPIVARGAAEAISFYLDLRFDPSVLNLRQVEAGTAATRFNLTSNASGPGRARLALYNTAPLGAEGEIAVATFEVIGRAGDRTTLSLPAYTVNEGRIAVTVTEGIVKVRGGR